MAEIIGSAATFAQGHVFPWVFFGGMAAVVGLLVIAGRWLFGKDG